MDCNSLNSVSTSNFPLLNFNLKKIILSFLDRKDQRTLYWLNKKLRPLLPSPVSSINIETLSKFSSFNLNCDFRGILEVNDGFILCWTTEGIKYLKINGNSLQFSQSLALETKWYISAIQLENGNIIYINGRQITICDRNFELIEQFKESQYVWPLCKISELSFAVGLSKGEMKIFFKNCYKSTKYQVEVYKFHTDQIKSIIYLPKHNYLLSGSSDTTINIFDLSNEYNKKLTSHTNSVSSLLSINEETFASASFDGEIKIWRIQKEFECIRTIYSSTTGDYVYLYLLGDDFVVSKSLHEFQIWDSKNFEIIKTCKEDSWILRIIVTKHKEIITATNENKVSIWKTLV